ncbi:MAG: hypothetical protein SFV23_22055 [Planctomycetaceae bacterium]|nr:hypothetical protein [Planctomycetaceae bacterium]
MTHELDVLPSTAGRCRSLLSKGLYINHGLPPGKEVAGDGNFWCGKTQTIFGPDQQICDRDECTNANRACFEG